MTRAAEMVRQELGARFAGEMIAPEHTSYDEARRVYNGMIDRRPALVARCAGPGDVAEAIAFARRHEIPVAVRGGGHNGAGFGVADGALVVDLSPMRTIEVDAAERTATVAGGCRWGEVDAATHEAGLATPSGIISTTGVGGLTLGGGHGYLTRRHGLTIDNLIGAELVLAGGERVRASEDENADLFWAIRGGGGNFGVVTSFRFRLHPVSTVVAGPTFWPLEQTAEVMRWYREFLPGAPRDLYGFFLLGAVPPAPPFPDALHGRPVCGVVWCVVGSPAAADELLAPVLDVGTPLLHAPQEVPYPALQSVFDDLYPTGQQWYWRGDFVRELPDEAIARHAEFGGRLPSGQSTMHLYPIDGAVHDVGPADTAFAFRDARWSSVFAGVDPDPASAGRLRDWTIGYWEAVHPYSAGGAYVNFMMDEGSGRVMDTYRDNYERLARVKAAYDPDNVFHINQNIRPATGNGAPA